MKKDKNFEELLRSSLKHEHPPADFTDRLMAQITDLEVKEERALKSVLQRDLLEEPSINFTDRVMAQINPIKSLIEDKPVISKKIWVLITAVIGSIFVYALFFVNPPVSLS